MDASKPVYIVDDDVIIRKALSIGLRSIGYDTRPFGRGEDFLDAAPDLPAGCVLLDMHMPSMDGLEVQRRLSGIRPDLSVLFMTAAGDVPMAVGAMRQGAVDFIEKPFADADLHSALASAYAKLPERARHDRVQTEAVSLVAGLSPREYAVVAGLVAGLSNKLIAHALGLGTRTIETYRINVTRKLGVRSVGEIVQLALRAGVEPLNTAAAGSDQ